MEINGPIIPDDLTGLHGGIVKKKKTVRVRFSEDDNENQEGGHGPGENGEIEIEIESSSSGRSDRDKSGKSAKSESDKAGDSEELEYDIETGTLVPANSHHSRADSLSGSSNEHQLGPADGAWQDIYKDSNGNVVATSHGKVVGTHKGAGAGNKHKGTTKVKDKLSGIQSGMNLQGAIGF